MNHVFFIDPIEKLNIKKDSSFFMAKSFKKAGFSVYLLFEQDFFFQRGMKDLEVYEFEIKELDDYYFSECRLKGKVRVSLQRTSLHMRIDPPFDLRYLSYLWFLDQMKSLGLQVYNDPRGIMNNNEKLLMAKYSGNFIPSFYGSSLAQFQRFCLEMKKEEYEELILKPLNLYSGLGIEKIKIDDPHLDDFFMKKSREQNGALVVQPFLPAVYEGEIRSYFFKDHHLGSIIKKPQKGNFLSNIAQGALFDKIEPESSILNQMKEISLDLSHQGVFFIAYDILGGKINEANITCPGLLNEVSKAHGRNVLKPVIDFFT